MNNAPIPYPYYGCGCDFNLQKYKEDCYFYGETHDMGATIRYCTRKEIKWGDCPCENCYNFLSKREVDRIVRKASLECERERTHIIHGLEYSEGQYKQIEELLETLYNTNSDNGKETVLLGRTDRNCDA